MTKNEIVITRINHIGIAPSNPELFNTFLREVLGLSYTGACDVVDQQTSTTFFQVQNTATCKQAVLETLAPMSSESPIANYLSKKKSGIHHIAFEVDDIVKTIAVLHEKKVQLINQAPKNGAHNTKIVFVHPKSTGGILIELVQQGGAK